MTLPDPPILAILRGLAPSEAADVADALLDAGLRMMEVPLAGPESVEALSIVVRRAGHDALVGAGTVRTVHDVHQVGNLGARLVVSPNADGHVIHATRARGLLSMPGVCTPTEGFAAMDAGAHALKLFPGELLTPPVVRAWRVVFPPTFPLVPVGGVTEENIGAYHAAGASGVGVGSAIYRPGRPAAEVAAAARAMVRAWQRAVG